MFQTRHRIRRIAVFSLLFVGLLLISTITPLEKTSDAQFISPKAVGGSYTQSALDFSALWNKTYGGFDGDYFNDLVACSDGGFAFVGNTRSFDTDEGDIWVLRTNYDGDVLWTKLLYEPTGSDYGRAIVECDNGDFVVVGISTSIDTDARIDRIDTNGNLIWSRLIGENMSNDYFEDVIETSTGNIIAIGRTESWGVGGYDVLIVCFAPNGNEIWTRTYGGAADESGFSVIESTQGGYAVGANTLSFGEGMLDFWLLQIDTSGNLIWDETYGGTNQDQCWDLVECNVGGFVLVGSTASQGDILGDFWAIRVDGLGAELWNVTYPGPGSDFATCIVGAVKGGFAIAGVYDYISGSDQARITRIGLDGTEIWSELYGGPVVDYAYGIVETYPEEFVVTGITNSRGSGGFDGWAFLVPGEPRLMNPPHDIFVEFGHGAGASLFVESSAPIDTWWLEDTSEFNIVGVGEYEGNVYRLLPPDVGIYEIWVHVNNTAGHETEHTFWIYVDDRTAPTWIDYQEEHTLEFGETFQYSLSANDLSALNTWTLEGSTAFDVDSNGQITSVVSPAVGDYYFQVTVDDIYGNDLTGDFHVSVQDTIPPTWIEAPQDQTIEYGTQFVYNLNATDLAGISTWSVDNTEFSVDSEGRVRNLITLAPGEHAVTVSVSDINGNILQTQFTVTVGSAPMLPSGTPGIFDSVIPFGVGVVATVAVVAVVCAMGRRRSPSAK